MKLDTKLVAGAAVLLSLTSTHSAAAAAKKYCLNAATGGSNCSFASMEMCRQTVSGRNGWCSEQVDFSKWGEGRSENSFAYYPPGGEPARRRMTQDERDLQKLHEDDMPTKGVGAE